METKQTHIALQVVGSPTSQFFFDLSLLYAKEVVQPDGFELLFAIVYPDGAWAVSENLDRTLEKVALSQLIELVQTADIVVPHIFCQIGLTSLRVFFEDILQLPVVGSSGHVAAIAQDKQLTKLLAKEATVRTPKGIRLTPHQFDRLDTAGINYPVIIKSNNTDNSNGLSLVKAASELPEAIQSVLQFDDEVLIEEYIEGRELRGAVIEQNGQYHALPFIEYGVNEQYPIRLRQDKYKFGENGELLDQSEKQQVPAYCPADLEEELQTELADMMIQMHQKLGCRDFSMYDFRVDQETNTPYLLEAGLFWSFSEASMISTMLKADGMKLMEVTKTIWMQAVKRKQA